VQPEEGNPMDSSHNSMRHVDIALCRVYSQVGEDVLVLQLAEPANTLSCEEVYSLALVRSHKKLFEKVDVSDNQFV
jgi:hypothetical protein